jgi:hypothetical protein
MDVLMTSSGADVTPMEEPLAQLERELMAAFLAAAGHDLHALLSRTDAEARRLLTDASLYATGRLTEVESRSHYLRALHGEP